MLNSISILSCLKSKEVKERAFSQCSHQRPAVSIDNLLHEGPGIFHFRLFLIVTYIFIDAPVFLLWAWY
jgi:hypothetical protein